MHTSGPTHTGDKRNPSDASLQNELLRGIGEEAAVRMRDPDFVKGRLLSMISQEATNHLASCIFAHMLTR